MERPADLPTRQGGVSMVGLRPSSLRVDRHDAVDGLIKRRDSRQKIIDGLSAGNLAPTDLPGDRNCAGIGELRHDNLLRVPAAGSSAEPSNIGMPTISSTFR